MNECQSRAWLAVTVDTEEEGLWSGSYTAQAAVKNIASVPRFQSLCDRFEIRPTYLVTTPVAQSTEAVKILRSIQDDHRCEIGTHVHPWNSPPIADSYSSRRDSFLCNLPAKIQHAKLEQLTDQIEKNFGYRPISFRAGRYGMDAEGIKILRTLGYRVDSSVLPRADYRDQDGPDFRRATCWPYHPSNDDILASGADSSLLEIPVTSGFTHQYFGFADQIRRYAMFPPWRQLRAVGVLDRTGIATKAKLSPEQATLKQMKRLAQACINRGAPILVLMFHSSSLMPGCTPYVQSEQDLNRFLNRLENFFAFALEDLSLKTIPLGECYQHRDRLIRRSRNC